MRISPTFDPTGSMMLNTTTTRTVNPACPAVNELTVGVIPATSTASGSTTHSRASWCPRASSTT